MNSEDKIKVKFIMFYTFHFAKELSALESIILSLFFEKSKTEERTSRTVKQLVSVIPFKTNDHAVRCALQRLKQKELIEIEIKKGRGNPNVYSVNVQKIVKLINSGVLKND